MAFRIFLLLGLYKMFPSDYLIIFFFAVTMVGLCFSRFDSTCISRCYQWTPQHYNVRGCRWVCEGGRYGPFYHPDKPEPDGWTCVDRCYQYTNTHHKRGCEWVCNGPKKERSLESGQDYKDSLHVNPGQEHMGSNLVHQLYMGSNPGQNYEGSTHVNPGQEHMGQNQGQERVVSDPDQKNIGSNSGQKHMGSNPGQHYKGSLHVNPGQNNMG